MFVCSCTLASRLLLFFIYFFVEPAPLLDIKTKAVNEMMERIKKGIVLKPIHIQVKKRRVCISHFRH